MKEIWFFRNKISETPYKRVFKRSALCSQIRNKFKFFNQNNQTKHKFIISKCIKIGLCGVYWSLSWGNKLFHYKLIPFGPK